MGTQVIIDLIKDIPDEFYVDDNNFILDKKTGTVILINPLDDQLIGTIPKEDVKNLRVEIEKLISNNRIEPEVLDKFDKKYCI